MATTGSTSDVKVVGGTTKEIRDPPPLGRALAEKSLPVVTASDDLLVASSQLLSTMNSTGFTPAFKARRCDIAVQVKGSATALTYQMQRSTKDPSIANNANWAPADDPVSGNPSNTSMQPDTYTEPGTAWWRANVTAISGGNGSVEFSFDGGAV